MPGAQKKNGKSPKTVKASTPKQQLTARAAAMPVSSPLISAPSAVTRLGGGRAPQVLVSGSDGSCVVRHREYIAEIAGASSWTTTSFVIQPALQTLFVWLASIAGNYDKYRFRRLRFMYENESSTAQAGCVVFAVDPDPLDTAPASKQEALSYRVSRRGAPWAPFDLIVPLSEVAQRDFYFTRSGAVPSGADQKMYDLGVLHVGVQGSSGATGELWVEYDIELHSPQANVNPISAKSSGTTSLTSTALIGADAAFTSGSNAGWSLTSASTFTCTVAGSYLFVGKFVGTTIVATSFGNSGGGTATLGANAAVTNTAATDTIGFVVVTAQVGQTVILNITSAATLTSAVWRISRYNASLA